MQSVSDVVIAVKIPEAKKYHKRIYISEKFKHFDLTKIYLFSEVIIVTPVDHPMQQYSSFFPLGH